MTPGITQQSSHGVGERRLATAALAGQPDHLATPDDQVDVVDGMHRIIAEPVVDAEPANLQQEFSRCRRVSGRCRRGDSGCSALSGRCHGVASGTTTTGRGAVGVRRTYDRSEAELRAHFLADALAGLAGAVGRAQPRVDVLVDAEVDQREAGAQHRDRQARRDVPPPEARLDRGTRGRVEQHGAPVVVRHRR